jgi:hypothetical protein
MSRLLPHFILPCQKTEYGCKNNSIIPYLFNDSLFVCFQARHIVACNEQVNIVCAFVS